MEYIPTIGLEIHAELKTATKMFCNSKNDPDEKRPNVNICPVCMAHPGTLPVINKEAVRHILRIGKALGGAIADFTEFDRKNYFYPDIPKGYQISQYEYPLVKGGFLQIPIFSTQSEDKNSQFLISNSPNKNSKFKKIAITRVHLEEDTARSQHDKGDDASFVDFNRAGVPLMELVTEPVISSAKEAGAFARELQLLLRYLGASEANMEKGELRVEANVSLLPHNFQFPISNSPNKIPNPKFQIPQKLGTKVEIKNINSFRAVERAIEYEIKRQSEALENGEKIRQETRGWNDAKQETFSQRVKEGAADYRYFPEPDLPKLKISEIEDFKNLQIPELPWEKRARYKKEYGIKDEDIESFVVNDTFAFFFEDVVVELDGAKEKIKLASNYITSDIAGLIVKSGESFEMNPSAFARLITMVAENEVSSRGAKDILAEMFRKGGDPKEIAERKGLLQRSDAGELDALVDKIIKENVTEAEGYKKGKQNLLQFLIGQAMKESRGSANPQVLKKLFESKLK